MRYKEINSFRRRWNVLVEFLRRPQRWKFLWYRIQWNYFPNMHIVPKMPLNVDVELADACNLKCVMCVHGTGTMKDVGVIQEDFAKDMIDQIAAMGVYSMKLNWRGEAAMHKKLAPIIAYAKSKGIAEVQMNTNGIPFDEEKIKNVINAGLDRIIFSVDGNSKETYESIRVGSNFEKLIHNIETFIRQKQEMGRLKPFIRVQMVRTNKNSHEVNAFIARWQNQVDDVRISDVMDRGQGNSMMVGDLVATGRAHCPQPFQRMLVARDGKVYPCCSDWYTQWPIGDANKDKLKDIWQSKRMNQLRKLINEDKMNLFEPCKSCYVKDSYTWRRLSKAEIKAISSKVSKAQKQQKDEKLVDTI